MQLTFKSGLYSRAAYTYTDTVFDIISIFEGKNSHLYYLDLKLDSSFDLRAKQAMMGPSLRGFAHAAVPAGITLNGLSCVVTTTMSIL